MVFEVHFPLCRGTFVVWIGKFEMGKSSGKKKQAVERLGDLNMKQNKNGDNSPQAYDKDTAVFIAASQELKEEGNKLFQRRDYEGATLKYEKALKLLPRNHIDVAYLRSNMAACYMQLGIGDYPRAIHECNLALEVSPKYSKALIKRARCYEGLNRLGLSLRDLNTVLNMEPNNLTAIEIAERVKQAIENKGNGVINTPVPEYMELPCASPLVQVKKVKARKKKGSKNEERKEEDKEDKKPEDTVVMEEKFTNVKGDEAKKTVKLVFGEDIRLAELPLDCSLLKLRKVVQDRFPTTKAVLVKYKDEEGDMITITADEELKWAEASASPEGSVRLYIVEVNPEEDPFYESFRKGHSCTKSENTVGSRGVEEGKEKGLRTLGIEEWIIHFAQLFKNYIGFSSDAYLDLHELGMKLYSDAMEETVTSEEAQVLFDMAAEKFQEMAALALFNCGNVHMARARKRVCFAGDSSRESILAQVTTAYKWAQEEFVKAGQKYEEALKIKPDFYEGLLALGQEQFEQAKLSWYYAIANNVNLDIDSFEEVLQLYNNAEDNVEKGMQMWEQLSKQHQSELSKPSIGHAHLQKTGLDNLFEDISADEAAEDADTMRSKINVLLGTILYERSIMEYKLQLPVWQECLEVAVEKFELQELLQLI
ncbi:hypothetical protein Nepgr_018363 [Nepenthes gracilis]|uniref:PB1 domain-containing protein n=1 Tax=Nepenthes gracilis TaxID=150966 RepID=A0AAD3SSS5_NEPGR|nr:hypothetical protein Nepgr_018363 [Nepenthes gracilis]